MKYRLAIYIFSACEVIAILVGCADQNLGKDILLGQNTPSIENSQYPFLMEQARWGNGEAYLQLAELYHKGKGIRQDFLSSLSMLVMADLYGGISSIEKYMNSLPSDDNFKLFYDALCCFEKNNNSEALEITDRMISNGFIEGYTLQGIITVEQGDTLEGKRILSCAVEQGSSFAELLLATMPDRHGVIAPKIESLTLLADRIPLACKLLGDVYADEDKGEANEDLAAMFYKKADEHGLLGRQAARWLLGYYTRNQLPVVERELERLSILSGNIDCSCKEDTSTVQYYDPILEDSIEAILTEKLNETNCDKGIVYVVETETGRLKAHVSIKTDGVDFLPYTDTYNQGRNIMVSAATYLALLTSDKVIPETEFDTGNGIYKGIRDHNWRRGGYGVISLNQALGLRSEVALTMAKESVYGDSADLYEEKMNFYLGGDPNHTIGILTFYNAVANGGRMVKIVDEGDDNFVLNEQIADKKYITLLQKGLKDAVKSGIFKKTDSKSIDVAACGRTFDRGDNILRMEICGYFPADAPQYTVMVILEKEGEPASSNGMCGPVIRKIAEVLIK